MINGGKFSLKYTTAFIFTALLCAITLFTWANHPQKSFFCTVLTTIDTIPKTKDTIPLTQRTDTLRLKMSKDSLDAPITYSASDSMVLDIPTKKITLYNKATTKYKDIDMSAYQIALDQPRKVVEATYSLDSTGNMVGRPKFIQNDQNMESDFISYNFETLKGITRSTYTQQGEMFVYGEKIKKVSLQDYYALHGRLTTCNLDTPHFAFRTNKMKLINQKLAVTGPIHPEFEGVPVPIYIPFGFFPISQGRHSGILPPQFTANEQFGLGLEGLGYYKVLNDYLDVMLRGDFYSYGGWRATLTPTYRKRYRYQGRFNLTMQRTRFLSDAGQKEFETNKSFNINWSHTVDSKARPGTSFSANVNAGSTQFNRYTPNNPSVNFQNQMNSSIAYSKNWDNKYNLTLSAGHDQNNLTRLINIRLPNGSFTVNNFYPFQRKEVIGEAKWYEKFGIGLNTQFASQTSFYDSLFSFNKILDTLQWGASHSIPLTLSLPSLGPLQIAPGISYQERWYSQQFIRHWDDVDRKLDTTIDKGFFMARDISFSLSLNTAIFGTFNRFGKNSRLRAIRHVIRPSISASYKPDLAKKDYYSTQVDTTGNTLRFSKYEGSMYGPFGEGRFGGLSFGLDNNLEMKVRSKKDTSAEGIKKVKLLDGFGFNGNYNFLADSFQLSNISLYARSTLFEKINITANANLDPYIVDEKGFRKNTLAWNQGGKFSLGRITNGLIAINTSFASKKKEEKEKAMKDNEDMGLPITMEEQQAQLDYIRNNPAEFADFDIPWTLNISYSLSFNRLLKPDYSGFRTEINSNISLQGDFNLTPKWKLGMSTYYDFKTADISQLTMYLSREMHCWQMSINVTPVGLYRFFNITISPKSSILRDVKVNRTRYFYGGN